MNKSCFYITTTLPYVNADPHAGFAMEIVRADAVARYKKQNGFEVFFNTGTDEHGQKLFDAALKAGKDVQTYVDEYAEKFRGLKDLLGISDDVHFIRTTDGHHVKAAQEFWKRVADNGFIYKKNYKAKYCVGCEEYKTESQLEGGICPLHPTLQVQIIDEENYFFKYSEFGDKILSFYDAHPDFVVPNYRLTEMREFIKRGLEDFSISRLKSKMSWGIPVPDDADHVMYVWFDALANYISTLGWPENKDNFEKFWANGQPVQYCGKDNTRFQAIMWQAMLIAAGLPNSRHIVVDGFVTGEGGAKMSKSVGNVINPYDVVAEFGTEAFRYFVIRELSPFEDSPFTMERFKDSYNGNLANGLGNLVNRVMKMAETNLEGPVEVRDEGLPRSYKTGFESFNLQESMNIIWEQIGSADKMIQELQPFKLVKDHPMQAKEIIAGLVQQVYSIGKLLEPFMPETSAAIVAAVASNKMPEKPLFMRKD